LKEDDEFTLQTVMDNLNKDRKDLNKDICSNPVMLNGARLRRKKAKPSPEVHSWPVVQDTGPPPPRYLDGTLFVDEHCQKTTLGGGGSTATGARNHTSFAKKGGELCSAEEGGEHTPATPFTVPKYAGTTSGAFGVASPVNELTGIRTGVKMKPLPYFGRWIVGKATYDKHLAKELKRH
jgi:hypothetical protein